MKYRKPELFGTIVRGKCPKTRRTVRVFKAITLRILALAALVGVTYGGFSLVAARCEPSVQRLLMFWAGLLHFFLASRIIRYLESKDDE